ncbi:MAG TPA: phosphatidate cytidylyltransferase [Clostridiales bacterium]|nr:phosphatidate cytidylyltransferase [Clostridiales bacterium]
MLKDRIITAIFIVLYIVLMIYFGGWFYNLSVLFFAFIGMHEIYNALHRCGYHPVTPIGYIFVLIFYFFLRNGKAIGGILTIILATITSLSMPVFNQKISPLDSALTILSFVYPGIISLCLIFLKSNCGIYGNYFVIFTFLTTWASDTFAYFIGSKFGNIKLNPNISPKKTVEGSIGGLIGSTITGFIIGLLYNNYFSLDLALIHYIIIGLLAGIFGQLGDLTASCIKRFCNVKDFGKILPGHGGIMDRFDSILFSLPIIFTYYFLFLI